MKRPTCCTVIGSRSHGGANKADGKSHPSGLRQRALAAMGFSLPTLVLALLPKCPACLAAYVALGTGISLSVAAASLLRTSLIGVCVAILVLFLASTLRTLPMNRLLPSNRIPLEMIQGVDETP